MSELTANEVVKIVQELKALERKFGGEDGLLHNLFQISESLSSQQLITHESKKELVDLFQKLQESKNLKIEVEKLKFDFVGKKEFEELQQLITYIKGFRSFMNKKTVEINDAYIKLNRFWLEEDDVLKRIGKLEKSFLITVLFSGVGIGIFLTITSIAIARYFL
jgi:hypothetical protein